MKAFQTRLVLAIGSLLVWIGSVQAEVIPLFTEDFEAFDARTDFGEDLHGVELISEGASPFNDGNAFRIFDLNPDDKPELQGEFFDPLVEPFRIDFQSLNQSEAESSSAIRFRMANTGKNISSEDRVAFSLSWQADGRLTAKYERDDGTVGTNGIFLPHDVVSEVTLVGNPAEEGAYTYTLFNETRTLDALSYDVFVDQILLSADFDTGMPFHLTRSVDEFDPFLGLQRFGLIGSSDANVDPDYLFDNIILRTGSDIAPEGALPVIGDTDLDGVVDVSDIDLLSSAVRDGILEDRFDINEDGIVNSDDRIAWVIDVSNTWFGDANLDGEFNSGDLVEVFALGEYEDTVEQNSTWATGDWSGDAEFTSADFVVAFADGGYEAGKRTAEAAVPEPTSINLLLLSVALIMLRRRR